MSTETPIVDYAGILQNVKDHGDFKTRKPYTDKQMAAILAVEPGTVYRLRTGRLKFGRQTIRLMEVLGWVE